MHEKASENTWVTLDNRAINIEMLHQLQYVLYMLMVHECYMDLTDYYWTPHIISIYYECIASINYIDCYFHFLYGHWCRSVMYSVIIYHIIYLYIS